MTAETDAEQNLLGIVDAEGVAADTIASMLPEGAWDDLSPADQQSLIDDFLEKEAEGDPNPGIK